MVSKVTPDPAARAREIVERTHTNCKTGECADRALAGMIEAALREAYARGVRDSEKAVRSRSGYAPILPMGLHYYYDMGCMDAADAIRALVAKEPNDG